MGTGVGITPEKGQVPPASESETSSSSSDSEEGVADDPVVADVGMPLHNNLDLELFKMGEFCCKVVATFASGNSKMAKMANNCLQINQRVKMEHCRQHVMRAGVATTIWNLWPAEKGKPRAYEALGKYFQEKQRIGLVEAPTYYLYIVPPDALMQQYFELQNSKLITALQVPMTQARPDIAS